MTQPEETTQDDVAADAAALLDAVLADDLDTGADGTYALPTKFKVGDKVAMPGVPIVVEVLELGTCDEPNCSLGTERFRFDDPGGLGSDWMHSSDFELAT